MPKAATALLDIVNVCEVWGNEAVAIRHLDGHQRFCVDDIGFLNNLVLVKQERCQRVHLFRLERSFLASRHGFVNEIKDRRRKRPVTPDRQYGLRRRECALTADEARSSVFVLSNIVEILAWVRVTERERDSKFVELSRYV